jgi:hypothetical protein
MLNEGGKQTYMISPVLDIKPTTQHQQEEYPAASALNRSCANLGPDPSLSQQYTTFLTDPPDKIFESEKWNANPGPTIDPSSQVATTPFACGKHNELLARLMSISQRSRQQQAVQIQDTANQEDDTLEDYLDLSGRFSVFGGHPCESISLSDFCGVNEHDHIS